MLNNIIINVLYLKDVLLDKIEFWSILLDFSNLSAIHYV